MTGNEWVRMGPGQLELRTWIGDSQISYRASWEDAGWTLTRRVDGAAKSLVMLRAVRSFALLDEQVDDDTSRGQ